MYLYNIAFCLTRANTGHIKYGATLIWADSIQEAKGYALEYIEKEYPRTEYTSHSIVGYKVDDAVIIQALAKMTQRGKHE